MRRNSLIVLLFLSVLSYGQKDAAAEPFLNKLANRLSGENALSINFSYLREDLQSGSKIEGSGKLVLLKEKYRLDLGDAIIYFDGVKQYSFNKEVEEVYVSIPDPENKEFMFSDPLRKLENYKQEFKYRLIGTDASKSTEEVQLYPEQLGGPYALIKLFFAMPGDDLKTMVVRHKEGIIYTMNVEEIKEKENPGGAFFRFDNKAFPNVDIIELTN